MTYLPLPNRQPVQGRDAPTPRASQGLTLGWGRIWLSLGALAGLSAVALGAWAAHGLAGRVEPTWLAGFQTGVQYQGLHALALLLGGALVALRPAARWLHGAGLLFTLGILLFSGSLYLRALTGLPSWGLVTPLGGGAFLLGWTCLLIGAWRD